MTSIAGWREAGRAIASLTVVVSLIACGDDGGGTADGDGGLETDGRPLPVDAAIDAVPSLPGTARYLAIASDGTAYLAPPSANGRIDRLRPGAGLAEPWVTLAGGPPIRGLAVRPANGLLYVAADDALWELDTTVATPLQVRYAPFHPHAVAIGGDGAVYFTRTKEDMDAIYRATSALDSTPVTANDFGTATDLFVDDDGSLLLTTPSFVIRIEVGPDHQQTRSTYHANAGHPQAIARDQQGRYYLASGGKLMRYPATTTFTGGEELTVGGASVGDVSDLVFAHGALGTSDLYLARGEQPPLRLAVGVGGRP